jgi:rod shape-determining protein MreC
MLNFVPERGASFTAARVIGDSGGVFVRSVLINAGKADRIEKGDAVVNGEGLIGRVAEAGRRSGRVLLISDLNSRIPVVAEKSRIRAILAGDNSPSPKLAFLSPNARLDVGDRIVTSGHGGVFPAGLPVGRIASVADGVIRVEPFADFHRLEYVRIITEYPGEVAGQIIPSMARPSRKR